MILIIIVENGYFGVWKNVKVAFIKKKRILKNGKLRSATAKLVFVIRTVRTARHRGQSFFSGSRLLESIVFAEMC